MGNTHSHSRKHNHYRRSSHGYGHNSNRSSPVLPHTPPNAMIDETMITPPLSTKSSPASRANSRPPSVMGDVKTCVQKMLGKSSSALDVANALEHTSSTHSFPRFIPKRSFSVPAENYFEKSISQQVTNSTIDGRTYQTFNSKYCLPIDEEEQDRLTNTHYVLKHCFGENYTAPVFDLLSVARDSPLPSPGIDVSASSVARTDVSSSSSSIQTNWNKQCATPARVLDVACGSGVWVLEMATSFPNSQFHGIDFACIYPNTIKPANTHFSHGDILDPEGFPYPDEYFDYVHMRLVYNCFSLPDLKFVLSEINRVLKPGGYVELRDIDPIIKNPGPTTDKLFSDFVLRMSQLHSVDVTWTKNMCEVLRQSELTDIHHQEVSVGFGYDGPLAASINCSISDSLKSYKKFFMEAYDMSPESCEEQIDQIIEESSEHHSFFNYYMAWGRKPLVSEHLLLRQDSPLPSVVTSAENSEHPSPLLSSVVMTENAFDIVHFANGFTE